jgi:hypothetical protein
MRPFVEHPGTIVELDLYSGARVERDASTVPAGDKYVYLDDGVETTDVERATERIPIVEIRTSTLDSAGNLVPAARATHAHVLELGPGGRPLRLSIHGLGDGFSADAG